MCSVCISITHSCFACSIAGGMSAIRNTATQTSAVALTNSRVRGGSMSTNVASRRCSLRYIAMAAPIIATQMNAIETVSSIQSRGLEKR